MAAIIRAPLQSDRTPSPDALLSGAPNPSQAQIARLADLYDEAAETASLANLLKRSPEAAAVMAIGTGLTATLGHVQLSALIAWIALVLAAVAATMYGCRRALAQPLARGPLRHFARDLVAIMLYAGFAWGAGAFLALPADASVLVIVVFAAGMGGVLAVLVRAWDAAVCFIAPATALCAAAVLVRPLDGGVATAALILASGFAAGALAWIAERVSFAGGGLKRLSQTPMRLSAAPGRR